LRLRGHKWDKKRIIKTVVFLALSLICLQGYHHIKLFIPTARYYQQLFGLLAGIFGILCFLNLRKLLPDTVKEELWNGARWVFGKINDRLEKVARKIREILGIPEPTKKRRGRDERSFVFDTEGDDRLRRFIGKSNQLRWKDLDNNADKVRFLFIKFVVRYKKKGYRYNTISTPVEVGKTWKLDDEDGGIMFPLYTVAKFSGGRRPITDDEVELSQKFAKVK